MTIALDRAQRSDEEIGDLVIAHLVEIAIVEPLPQDRSASRGRRPRPFSRAKPCVEFGPLDPLPQTGLLVEAIEFDAAEIETRDDSHDFASLTIGTWR